MSRLNLAYEDGFENDSVVVRIDGKEVARRDGLTSSLATALAGTAQAEVADSSGPAHVVVQARNLSASLDVDLSAQPHLAVAIRDGKLVLRASDEASYYL